MQYYGTLGPACSSPKILEAMFRAGMTGVRLNLSHGGLEENGAWLSLVQKAAAGCAKRPEILIDLRGPELRIGKIPEEILHRRTAFSSLAREASPFRRRSSPI